MKKKVCVVCLSCTCWTTHDQLSGITTHNCMSQQPPSTPASPPLVTLVESIRVSYPSHYREFNTEVYLSSMLLTDYWLVHRHNITHKKERSGFISSQPGVTTTVQMMTDDHPNASPLSHHQSSSSLQVQYRTWPKSLGDTLYGMYVLLRYKVLGANLNRIIPFRRLDAYDEQEPEDDEDDEQDE